MEFYAGVDTHKDTHHIAILSHLGQVMDLFPIPTTPEGFAEAIERAKAYAPLQWGLEGTGSYGRRFADALLVAGFVVYEVPGTITKRHRRRLRQRGKSDPQDAHAIAEAVLREHETLRRHLEVDTQEATRLLYERRDRKVKERSAKINVLRAIALRLGLEIGKDMTTIHAMDAFGAKLQAFDANGYSEREAADEARDLLTDIRRLHTQVAELEKRLHPFVKPAAKLLEIRGCSIINAAGIIGHTGAISNFSSSDKFAAYAGTAPVACSSGKYTSYRLNIGGNRELNRCIHSIALVQTRTPNHPGQIYYEQKRAEGKTHREAMRCLKRQLSNVIFRALKQSAALGAGTSLAIAA